MTQQETLDIVINGLRAQGCKSIGEYASKIGSAETTTGCCYRGANGTKCAAGQLIPNDKYKPEMEGLICSNDNNVRAVLLEEGHDLSLCRKLQTIHDCYEPYEWEEKFRNLADGWNLVYTPPTINV